MKIKLTEDQINQLVAGKEAAIRTRIEKAVAQLENQRDNEIASLRKKYENYEVNFEEEKEVGKKRLPINEAAVIRLHKEGKNPNQIAKEVGATYAGVNAKLTKLGLKEDKPKAEKVITKKAVNVTKSKK